MGITKKKFSLEYCIKSLNNYRSLQPDRDKAIPNWTSGLPLAHKVIVLIDEDIDLSEFKEHNENYTIDYNRVAEVKDLLLTDREGVSNAMESLPYNLLLNFVGYFPNK